MPTHLVKTCIVTVLVTLVSRFHTVLAAYDELPECDLDYGFNDPPTHCIPFPVPKCPVGSSQVGDACLRVVYTEQTVKCPHGSELVGHECVTKLHVEPSVICPAGYYLAGKKIAICERIETIHTELLCQDGYTLHRGSCNIKHKHKTDLRCPHGYRNTQNGCVKETKTRPVETCPPGYKISLHKSECIRTITVPAGVGCRKDYTLLHGDCVKEKRVKIGHTCPHGFRNDGNFCIKETETYAEQVCPNGYEIRGHFCEGYITAESFPVCPKHYDIENGLCVHEQKHGPYLVCPKGSQSVGDDCITKTYVTGELSCPPNTYLKGNRYCVAVASVPAEHRCPVHYSEVDGNCVKLEKKKHINKCPHGFGFAGGDYLCTRVLRHKADISCNGRSIGGHKCETTSEVIAERRCRHGELNDQGNCTSKHGIPAEGFCRKGYSIVAGKTDLCQRAIYASSEAVCPDKSEFKRGRCEVCTSHQPHISCSRGYTISPSGTCQRTETAKPVYTCPKGYVMNDGLCFPIAETSSQKQLKRAGHHLNHHRHG